jgi:molecular chaperone GrpE
LANEETNAVDEQTQPSAAENGAPQAEEAAASTPGAADVNDAVRALQSKADEYLTGWQRERAEFANYKKRIEREIRESQANGSYDALKSLLPVVDDFERAAQNIPQELAEHPWVKGTMLLLPKLHKLLSEYSVETLDPVGEVFDPNKHEAVAMDDSSDVESGRVTATLQKGYISGDRVLRLALVRVKS